MIWNEREPGPGVTGTVVLSGITSSILVRSKRVPRVSPFRFLDGSSRDGKRRDPGYEVESGG